MTALDGRNPPEPQALACAMVLVAMLLRGSQRPRRLKPAAQERNIALSC
jgi:hypothetical protein